MTNKRKFGVWVSTIIVTASVPLSSSALFTKLKKSSCLENLTLKSVNYLWRQSERDTLMALRSNAPHFYAWSKWNAALFFDKDILKIEGVILGDVHNRNFGVVALNQKVSNIRVVDLDDGGIGPFILDIANYIHRTKMTVPKIKASDVFNAYIKGILGEALAEPKVLESALQVSADKIQKERAKKTSKFLKTDKNTKKTTFNFEKKDELAPITELGSYPKSIQNSFRNDEKMIESSLLSDGYKIIDRAIRVKEDGGSQGIPRFVYLVKKDKQYDVISFKQFGEPGTAQYREQMAHAERFKQIVESYWPSFIGANLKIEENKDFKRIVAGDFQVVFNSKRTYLRFPKGPDFLEYDDTPDDIDEIKIKIFAEMTFYNANYLGLRHGQQEAAEALRNYLIKNGNDKKLLNQIKLFIAFYQEDVDKLHNKNE